MQNQIDARALQERLSYAFPAWDVEKELARLDGFRFAERAAPFLRSVLAFVDSESDTFKFA